MNWQRLAAPALAVLIAGACSGGEAEPPAAAEATTTSTTTEPFTTESTEAPSTTTTTTSAESDQAPSSLAFASTTDIGRLFELDGANGRIDAYEGPHMNGEKVELAAGALVQATNARASDGVIWVLVAQTEGERATLGWVDAEFLLSTSRSILEDDPDLEGELRKVATTVRDDALEVRSSPASGSVVATLPETSIAMHGGSSALVATGERWVDVIDSSTRARIGWVTASDFATVRRIDAKYADASDVARRASNDLTYGATLRNGSVSAVGCNAAQITFTTASGGDGTAILFGMAIPTGQALNGSPSVFRWSSSGGSTVFARPGETVTFTFPTDGPRNWYFASLDDELQAVSDTTASGTRILDPNGKAIATEFQSFSLDGGSCVYVAPVEEEETGLNPYILDLPPDERDAEIAAFEEAQAGDDEADTEVQSSTEETPPTDDEQTP